MVYARTENHRYEIRVSDKRSVAHRRHLVAENDHFERRKSLNGVRRNLGYVFGYVKHFFAADVVVKHVVNDDKPVRVRAVHFEREGVVFYKSRPSFFYRAAYIVKQIVAAQLDYFKGIDCFHNALPAAAHPEFYSEPLAFRRSVTSLKIQSRVVELIQAAAGFGGGQSRFVSVQRVSCAQIVSSFVAESAFFYIRGDASHKQHLFEHSGVLGGLTDVKRAAFYKFKRSGENDERKIGA